MCLLCLESVRRCFCIWFTISTGWFTISRGERVRRLQSCRYFRLTTSLITPACFVASDTSMNLLLFWEMANFTNFKITRFITFSVENLNEWKTLVRNESKNSEYTHETLSIRLYRWPLLNPLEYANVHTFPRRERNTWYSLPCKLPRSRNGNYVNTLI